MSEIVQCFALIRGATTPAKEKIASGGVLLGKGFEWPEEAEKKDLATPPRGSSPSQRAGESKVMKRSDLRIIQ